MSGDGPKSGDKTDFSAHRRKGSSRRRGRRQNSVDHEVARIAFDQYGLVSLHQLRQLGLARPAVYERLQSGRLHRVESGVYAVGHRLLGQQGRWMAAVLACGPGAVLSHRSAAALWGLRQDGRGSVDVTAPNRRGRTSIQINAHRDGSLHPEDREEIGGIPCTSLARTLLDFAAVASPRALHSAITQAEVLRVFDLRALKRTISRNRGRRGVARLRLAIAAHDTDSEKASHELERRFLALCRRARLPRPEVNSLLDLDGVQIVPDFLWREARLVVETDGRRFHGTAAAFESDRLRDQRLVETGWRVIRCTWRQVVDEPTQLLRTLRALLSQPQGRSG